MTARPTQRILIGCRFKSPMDVIIDLPFPLLCAVWLYVFSVYRSSCTTGVNEVNSEQQQQKPNNSSKTSPAATVIIITVLYSSYRAQTVWKTKPQCGRAHQSLTQRHNCTQQIVSKTKPQCRRAHQSLT